jgi:hypothetical protein
MSERFHGQGSVAVGSDKALLNLFRSAATPTSRAKIFDIIIGCGLTPADAASLFQVQRTTAVGTEGGGFTPVNVDPDGPASQSDFGVGAFTGEPTKTANAFLLQIPLNQRATHRWVAFPGGELILPATQNNGACLKSASSTVTTAHDVTMFFEE